MEPDVQTQIIFFFTTGLSMTYETYGTTKTHYGSAPIRFKKRHKLRVLRMLAIPTIDTTEHPRTKAKAENAWRGQLHDYTNK